jgi:signal transduction histidine kinase
MVLYHVVADYEPLYLDRGYSADMDGSSLEKIFNSGTDRIINDLEAYLEENPGSESTKLLVREGIHSSITCTLKVEERNVGLLFFSSKERNAYGKRHLLMHRAVSERLSQAVEKAYRIEELSETINAYMEMLSFVTHELKSPLDSMITMGNTLADGYYGELDEKKESILRKMVGRAERLSDMVAQYLNLSRFEMDRVKQSFRETDLMEDILKPSVEMVEPQLREKGMELGWDLEPEGVEEWPRIICDPELLRVVTDNLLGNGVKYGNEKGEVRIRVRFGEGNVEVSVWNQGPGFPEEAKKKLFRRFSRIEKEELMKRKGTGIGLYTSWKIIRLHGGRIWADSEEGKWAEFIFRVPLKPEGSDPE